MNELYEQMGEQAGIRRLVDTFYDIMDELPEVRMIRDLHPDDLTSSREKLYEFLVGWSGGPPLFEQKYGHPRLRMRHMPFPIGADERDMWLLCMRQALKDCYDDPSLHKFLDAKFSHIADFMRNVPEGGADA